MKRVITKTFKKEQAGFPLQFEEGRLTENLSGGVNPHYKKATHTQLRVQIRKELKAIIQELRYLRLYKSKKPDLERMINQFIYVKFAFLKSKLKTYKANLIAIHGEVKDEKN